MTQKLHDPSTKWIDTVLQYPQNANEYKVGDNKDGIFTIEFHSEESYSEKKNGLFRGAKREFYNISNGLLVGLGKEKNFEIDDFAAILLQLGNKVKKISNNEVQLSFVKKITELFSVDEIINLTVTAFENCAFTIEMLKSKNSDDPKEEKKTKTIYFILADDKAQVAIKKYSSLSKHIQATRQVQALPGNFLTAQTMEKRAREIAKSHNLKITVWGEKKLEELGAGGILAVNQGSMREPRMIAVEYEPKHYTKTFAIVGKGVTFDTGGISLKPPGDMHEMKYDMSGSAAALHAVAAIADLQLPIRVVSLIGMVENMPDGAALKPGDVYKSLKGLTIEVQNTDAEGRLVLADLLHFAEREYKPDLMVNLATLTGACLVALGQFYAGLFSEKKDVRVALRKAAKKSLEPVWALPMGNHFKSMLKSNIADYNNIGGRLGGSSTAASFLSLFVDKKTNWAHLDIAGVGFIKKSYNVYPAVASGYGIRLLTQIAEDMI